MVVLGCNKGSHCVGKDDKSLRGTGREGSIHQHLIAPLLKFYAGGERRGNKEGKGERRKNHFLTCGGVDGTLFPVTRKFASVNTERNIKGGKKVKKREQE